MLVAVTGASGFLGREVVGQLLAAGHRVRAICRTPVVESSQVEWVAADVTAPLPDDALAGVDALIHAAGLAHQFGRQPSFSEYEQTNVRGTQGIFEAAVKHRVRRAVLVSSVSVYGGNMRGPICENTTPAPRGPYAETKAHGEQVAIHIARDAGLPLVVLRLPAIYGPGDPGNVARLMRSIDRRRFVWLGQGTNLKSLIYVSDAARAVVLAVNRARACSRPCYNVVGSTTTMRKVVEGLACSLARQLPRWHIPADAFVGGLNVAACVGGQKVARIQHTVAKWLSDDAFDGSRFETDFSFQPAVSLYDGLTCEVAWYRGTLAPSRPLSKAA